MARSLESFPVSEDGFSLPINEVLTGRGFVTGKSGSGKSNTASVIAEELLERGLGLMIIDTDGEYHGLKERYELLHVGADEECDRQVNVEDANFLADLALEENVPIILDVSGYMDADESKEIIHAVVRELFVMEKSRQKPFLMFVEEAHEFIPEQGGGDDLTKMLVRVAKRGRKRGLGIVAMSQRPAAVSKEYITQCDWLIWHRLTWENDTKVAGRILGGDARESIQSLDTGEAMVMTDWDESIRRVQFRRKKTVDAGATPTLQEAYGPPSARDNHLADDGADDPDAEEDSDADGDGADADAAGGEADEAGDETDGDGGEADAEAGEPAPESEAADDVDPGVPDDRPDPGSVNEPTPDDRSAVKEAVARRAAANRQVSATGTAEPAGDGQPAGAAPPAVAGAGAGGAAGTAGGRPSAAGGSPEAGTEPAASGRGASATDGGAATAESGVVDRFEFEEPDEFDPIWEFGQLFVYLYGVIVGAHARLLATLEGGFLAGQARVRQALWGTQRAGTGRGDHLLARVLSLTLVVAGYAVVGLAVVLIVLG